jgi:hypothetical protein
MQIHIEGPELRHLSQLPRLEELRLSEITDEAAAHLAGCDQLRVLRILSSEKLTDKGLERLPTLPSLERLQLVRTGTTERAANALKERFPSLEVLHQNDR